MSEPRPPRNRLKDEASPYLRQHAHNPVDWYPYGAEALARSRDEDKPILLSIGYSACHWCHVMERESFDDDDTASQMNEQFVCIKVDREERPDLDQIYQTVVQLMRRSGGWPLTVFLTPSLRPFFGGTYFPPTPRYGMPDFRTVLDSVAGAYRDRHDDVQRSADELTRAIEEVTQQRADPLEPPDNATLVAGTALLERIDREHGGFGTRPKFPNTMALEVLLRASVRGLDGALDTAIEALNAMRSGGMFDQLGGGFHRYSTDERWLVPHFEKMLYDNALLVRLYANAYRITRDPALEEVVERTLQYVLREMCDAEGRFFSSQDADSEGREGAFFVFTEADVDACLPAPLAEIGKRAFGVSEAGNFEESGATVLHRAIDLASLARERSIDETTLRASIEEARALLFEARERRERPFRDEKVLATWNGLMIEAFAEAGSALGEPRFVQASLRAFDAVLSALRVDGELYRVSFGGEPPRVPGFLEDYADLANAALAVHRATLEARPLEVAIELVDAALALFEDDEGGFFFTRAGAEDLLVRTRDAYDNAVPSGTSAMVHALLALAAITSETRYEDAAMRAIRGLAAPALRHPLGFGHLLCGIDRARFGMVEVVVVAASREDAAPLLDAARQEYVPDLTLRFVEPNAEIAGLVPHRLLDGRATAYVCRRGTCSPPVDTVDELVSLLRESQP